MRTMVLTSLLCLLTAGFTSGQEAAGGDPWIAFEGGEGPGQGKHIVLLSGDEEYRSEEALPMLAKVLSKRHGFRCTVLFAINPETGEIDPNNQNNVPGMQALESADLMIIAFRFRKLPDDSMKYIDDYVQSGKPIIGLRTATHAFNYGNDKSSPYSHYSFRDGEWKGGFGQQVLGDTWINHHGHHGKESTRGVPNSEHAGHPILRGVTDVWGPTDVYGVRNLGDDATVLLHGQVLAGMKPSSQPVEGKKNDPMMPLAWVRSYTGKQGKAARIFCTTMGSSTDFASAGLRRTIVNASYWCVGLEDKIPAESNVDLVGKYEPTAFGFNRAQKGVKPADHLIGD